MKTPKISVIIPLYNHEKYIREAVYSVLEQTVSDFELIIIDDGSTDGSEGIVSRIKDERIQYYFQENRGAHYTINRGIKLAEGEYISILNSDDVYYSSRFEEVLKILEGDHSIRAVFSHIEFIDEKGEFIRYKKGAEDNWKNKNPETSFKGEDNIVLDLLAGNFLITTSNLFCRKSAFQDIGLFQKLIYAHDYEFFLRLCYHYKVYIVDKPLLKYRIHSENTYGIENKAEADFEVGLVLSNFFLNYDLKKVLPDNDIYTNVAKFFNSINTFHSERMILTLVVFALNYNIHNQFINDLTENTNNTFRINSINYIKSYIDVWKESQKAWRWWKESDDRLGKLWCEFSETNVRFAETKKKLSEENKRLIESEKKLSVGNMRLIETKKKLSEENKRLVESEKKLSEISEKYVEKTKKINSLLNSRSYRLGRVLTWPIRKLLFISKICKIKSCH